MSITGSSVQSAENIICPSGKSAHSSLSQFTFVFVCCSAFASLLDSSSPHTFQHSKPALQHSNIPSFHLGCFFSGTHLPRQAWRRLVFTNMQTMTPVSFEAANLLKTFLIRVWHEVTTVMTPPPVVSTGSTASTGDGEE